MKKVLIIFIFFGFSLFSVNINFEVNEESKVSLGIFDKDGKLIKTLITGKKYTPGKYSIEWDGKDQEGKDLKGELKYLITKFSDGEAFEPIVLFGKNTAYPHGVSSNTKLKINKPILLDFGVNVNGYNSDFTRTIFFGKPSDEFKKKYEIVKSALDLAIEKLEANQEAKNLANVVIEYFKNFGVEKNFTHALGHGLGVYLHNFPLLSHKSNHRIPDNIILALEPALYFEGKFGIRIEQNILLYNGKKELLTKTKDELIIL